jgi:hypothetical protein
MEYDEEITRDDPSRLSDEELEEELTIAATNEHRDDLYRTLLAERERRRPTSATDE